MKFCKNVSRVPSGYELDFLGVPGHDPDPGILEE